MSAEEVIQRIKKLLLNFLGAEVNTYPYAWKRNLRNDLAAEKNTTGRIFLKAGGAKAWLAYLTGLSSHCNLSTELDRRTS